MKTISIDLDGVLNTYSGYKDYDKDKICPLKSGAYEFVEKLNKNFNIEIYTVREKNLVKNWLEENNLLQFVSNITNKKNPLSSIFLDDRAITFKGDYNQTYKSIINFTPYWENDTN